MKILHTADWHLGTFRSPVKDGVNLRTEDTKRCLDELIRVANEEKPDYSLVSGDIFHVGRLWSDRCCEEIITAIHYIRELAAVSKQVVVMRGTPNHDGSGQFNVLSEMFADVPNVHVVITPQVISFDDVDIAVLPGFDRGVFRANHPGLSSDEENVVFTNELSNIVTGLKAQCSPEKKSILMAHYTVPGCNTESGQTMMLTQFEPIIPQEALLAANYNLVALGHIHRPQLEKINQRENNLALIKAALEHLKSNISEAENRLAEVKLKGTQAETERDIYAKAFEEHVHVLSAITALDPWVEKEKMLPVAEERNATALNRVLELTAEITGIDDEISERQAEADKEILAMAGMEEAQAIVNGLDTEVNAINSMVKEKQMRIGALQQKSEQIAKLKQDIAALQDKQVEYAKETADYDTLKVAFSQSGVPHQIIRSIIPQLTATANTILGQMTGGKMGVEFRLERLQKNGKEKVSLDIYIEEYGKSVLPYLSKSGGEKVKSSLSVILALAEIKSSSAGIQLGMLFIDEPPFLDGDGIQAYCDAFGCMPGSQDLGEML